MDFLSQRNNVDYPWGLSLKALLKKYQETDRQFHASFSYQKQTSCEEKTLWAKISFKLFMDGCFISPNRY